MAKKKYTQADSKKVLSAIKEFNSVSNRLLKLLFQKAAIKQKRIGNIRLLLDNFTPPKSRAFSTISIQTVDIRNSVVKKGSRDSYNQKMNWEDDLRQRKRGSII